MSRRVFVIGGGNFGTQLAKRLAELGAEVIIAERSSKRMEELSGDGFHVMELDAEDETALMQAGVQNADVVVVSIGQNLQGSIIATLALKDLGIKKIVARAVDDKHAKVLGKVGADIVILPTRDMANRLAERLLAKVMSERTPVIEDFQIAHICVGENFEEGSLVDLKLPQKHKITVLLILRGETEEDMDVLEASPDIYVRQDDVLVVFGKRECINEYERKYGVHKNL
ncbi:MAG TPA: TrkA family potassium uptake protein [Verrucomicrobiota bacterium]|jgi:trk system potassium uptake protein TrkA|nr:TrkA family potassium uptake protein [Verrucomicrobiota bacterium]